MKIKVSEVPINRTYKNEYGEILIKLSLYEACSPPSHDGGAHIEDIHHQDELVELIDTCEHCYLAGNCKIIASLDYHGEACPKKFTCANFKPKGGVR